MNRERHLKPRHVSLESRPVLGHLPLSLSIAAPLRPR